MHWSEINHKKKKKLLQYKIENSINNELKIKKKNWVKSKNEREMKFFFFL